MGVSALKGVLSPAFERFEKETGIKLVQAGDIENSKTSFMFKDVVDGKAEAAVTAAPLQLWSDVAQKEAGVTSEQAKMIVGRVVGFDRLQFFVNTKQKVRELKIEQLAGIGSGRLKDWKELGGEPAAHSPLLQ